jgi:hypothetical protein
MHIFLRRRIPSLDVLGSLRCYLSLYDTVVTLCASLDLFLHPQA